MIRNHPALYSNASNRSPRKTIAALSALIALLAIAFVSGVDAQDREEQLFWESVNCDVEEEMSLYLEEYPRGAFVQEARDCIKTVQEGRDDAAGEQTGDEIQQQLAQCQAHIEANRLTSGAGGNALDCYRAVLALDADNPEAQAGLKRIEDIYARWARSAVEAGRAQQAQTNLDKLKQLNPEHHSVAELEQSIASLKEQARQQAERERQEAAEASRQAERERAREQDRELWETVSCDNEDQLRSYKSAFPDGLYVQEADDCLNSLEEARRQIKSVYGFWRGTGSDILAPSYDVILDIREDDLIIRANYPAGTSCEGRLIPEDSMDQFDVGDTMTFEAKLSTGPCFQKAKVKLDWTDRNRIEYAWYKLGMRLGGGEVIRQ